MVRKCNLNISECLQLLNEMCWRLSNNSVDCAITAYMGAFLFFFLYLVKKMIANSKGRLSKIRFGIWMYLFNYFLLTIKLGGTHWLLSLLNDDWAVKSSLKTPNRKTKVYSAHYFVLLIREKDKVFPQTSDHKLYILMYNPCKIYFRITACVSLILTANFLTLIKGSSLSPKYCYGQIKLYL